MKSLWFSRGLLIAFIAALGAGVFYIENNLSSINIFTQSSLSNQADSLFDTIENKIKFKHQIQWDLPSDAISTTPRKITFQPNSQTNIIKVTYTPTYELKILLPHSMLKKEHLKESNTITTFYSYMIAKNHHFKRYHLLAKNFFSPLKIKDVPLYNRIMLHPMVVGLILDYINEDYLPLSNLTFKGQHSHKAGVQYISNLYFTPTIVLYTTSFLVFLILLLLLTRRSFIAPLVNEMKSQNIAMNDSASLIWRLTPYLLFPGESFKDTCKTICSHYKISLEKKIAKKEFQIFKQQSQELVRQVKSLCNHSGITSFALQLHQIPKGIYSQQQYQDRIFQLKRIEKSIQFTLSQIHNNISTKEYSIIWETVYEQLQTFNREKFITLVTESIRTVANSIKAIPSKKSPPLQPSNNIDDISPPNQIALAKEKEKKILLIDLQKTVHQKYNQNVEMLTLNELKIVHHLLELISSPILEIILNGDFKQWLSNTELLDAIKSNNRYQIELIISNEPSFKKDDIQESDFLPLLGKRILLAGGDQDQINNYTESLKNLGASDVKVVLENSNVSRNSINGKFDTYIYIATRISHSLRYQITNLTKKNKGELIVLNQHRSAFFNELKSALQYW